jgi:hypothetical protein
MELEEHLQCWEVGEVGKQEAQWGCGRREREREGGGRKEGRRGDRHTAQKIK